MISEHFLSKACHAERGGYFKSQRVVPNGTSVNNRWLRSSDTTGEQENGKNPTLDESQREILLMHQGPDDRINPELQFFLSRNRRAVFGL
ncbi:MAG: hypothetical protein QM813_27385 [Verrucomicrobiota bacterium]